MIKIMGGLIVKAYSMFMAMLAAGAVSAGTMSSGATETRVTLEASPNLNDDLRQVVFGELWHRTELSKRDRSLVSLTATVIEGGARTQRAQFALALENGVSAQELAGALSHLVYYSGIPVAVEAEAVLADVLAGQGIKLSSLRVAEAAAHPDPKAAQAQREVVLSLVGDISPGLAHFSNTTLNGDLWLRGDLSPRDRSLVTISALISQGNIEQLPVHVRKGIGNGLKLEEIGEVITQLAFYAGWPRAFSAATAIKAMNLSD